VTPEERLAEERRVTSERLDRLRREHEGFVTASRDSNADDEHDPEGATIAFERSQVGALAQRLERQLAEVDVAVARLAEGSYGTCERCGGRIPDERLEARPTARTCVGCAG